MREDCFLSPKRPIRIPSHALWTDECTCGVPKVNGEALAGLNPEQGPDFMKVYTDDAIVFSPTLTDHLHHLRQVFDRIQEAGLKLKPTKCRFVAPEIE